MLREALMIQVNSTFSYFIFWIENIILIAAFFIRVLVLSPFAYLKNFYVILKVGISSDRKIGYFILWLISGIPVVLYIVFKDVF